MKRILVSDPISFFRLFLVCRKLREIGSDLVYRADPTEECLPALCRRIPSFAGAVWLAEVSIF